MLDTGKCQCLGAIHPGHFECPERCRGGHDFIRGKWMRCNHDGSYSPYETAGDRRNTEAAHQARADLDQRFDARAAAAGEREPELEHAGA